jgi:hypothetical protein
MGLTQKPRQVVDKKTLAAPLMKTIPAAKSTLKQRLGRVGRTCNGHYVALYRNDSIPPRDEHIEPTTMLFPDLNICFSLSKQLRFDHNIFLHFPGLPIPKCIVPLQEKYFRFPELGGKSWADAFFKSLELGCSMDIMLLAAFWMKVEPKIRVVIAHIVTFLHVATIACAPISCVSRLL